MQCHYLFQPGPHSPPASASSLVSEDVKPAAEFPTISLSARQKGLVVTGFDTGASIEELSLKFGVPTEVIESIILDRAEVIRDQTAALMAETEDERDKQLLQSARKKNRVRRTSFVGLNILMWRFFKDCRDNGIVLNGKLLKEHAMMISRQLGLENFKGSEGWLDAFKRRHKIDLKNMSGVPVNYEETDDDKMEEDHDDGTTAALLDCVEKASAAAPGAVASISSTKPLDLGNLFNSADGAVAEPSSNCSRNMVNGGAHVSSLRVPSQISITPSTSLDENGFIAAVVKSAAISVHDKELSSALETIRSYILANDASAMPAFLELQMKLAVLYGFPLPTIVDLCR
ncbi:centromere binding protein B, DNA binding protein [Ancylostoma duodenale]|uniref:Centromere binding protein B, DNA binding protein n=1 Tax=Ancylostoma duodenale TaxID=51022 RepID=A0A0C2GZ69_9BILA|nr:centromere binding protein B, DNA binding protein [Ancylostoma duodenale]